MARTPEQQAELDAINAELARRGESSSVGISEKEPPRAKNLPPETQAEIDAINAELVRRGNEAPVKAEPRGAIGSVFEAVGSAPGRLAAWSGLFPESVVPTKTEAEGGVLNPELEKTGDLYEAPELNRVFSPTTYRAFAATANTDLDETAKILQNLYPKAKVEKRGKYLAFTSPENGYTYTMKPGFRRSDIERAIIGGGLPLLSLMGLGAGGKAAAAALEAAGAPGVISGAAGLAGKAADYLAHGKGALAGALGQATQAAIGQGIEASAGGTADALPVVSAGVIGGGIPAAGSALKGAVNLPGALKAAFTGAGKEAAPVAGAAAQQMTNEELMQAARSGAALTPEEQATVQAGRVAEAEQRLADFKASLSPETRAHVEAKTALQDIEGKQKVLQDQYRALEEQAAEKRAQMAANAPSPREAADRAVTEAADAKAAAEAKAGTASTKAATAAEEAAKADAAVQAAKDAARLPPAEGLESQAAQAKGQQLVEQMTKGGDKSALNAEAVKELNYQIDSRLARSQTVFRYTDRRLGSQVITAPETEKYIVEKIAPEYGGEAGLPQMLKDALEDIRGRRFGNKVEGFRTEPPTYNLLDRVRKQFGIIGYKGATRGADTTIPQRIAKGLYAAAAADQKAAVQRLGSPEMLTAFETALREFGEARNMEKGAVKLLGAQTGPQIAGDIVGKVESTLSKLPRGGYADFSKAINRLSKLPAQMKSDVLMTALGTSFGDIASGEAVNLGGLGKWIDKVKGQTVAWNQFTSNLTPEAKALLEKAHGAYKELGAALLKEGAQSAEQKAARKLAIQTAEDRAAEATRLSKAATKEANDATKEATKATTAFNRAKEKVQQLEIKAQKQGLTAAEDAQRAQFKNQLDALGDQVKAAKQKVADTGQAMRETAAREKTVNKAMDAERTRIAKEAEDAAEKAAKKDNKSRKVLGTGMALAGYGAGAVGHWGIGAPLIGIGHFVKSDTAKQLLSDGALRRFMDAIGVPKSAGQQWLERSLTASLPGAAERSGMEKE